MLDKKIYSVVGSTTNVYVHCTSVEEYCICICVQVYSTVLPPTNVRASTCGGATPCTAAPRPPSGRTIAGGSSW